MSEIAVTDNNKSNDIQEVKSDLQQPKMFSELLTSSTPKSEDQEHVDAENELQQPGLANISAEEYLRMRNLLAATENALHQAYERIDRLTNQKPASMGPTTDVLEGLENTLKLGVSVASIPLRVTNEQLKAPFDKETLSAKSALETYLQEEGFQCTLSDNSNHPEHHRTDTMFVTDNDETFIRTDSRPFISSGR